MTITADEIRPRPAPAMDEAARFEAAFLEHWPKVYGVLFRLLGERAEAEDLALETFWRLYRNPPSGWENFGGWLYRVATRLGFNALRSKRRRASYEDRAGKSALLEKAPPDPAEVVEREELRRQVREVLSRMKPRSAKLLILRHSGLNYSEIATALQMNPASVGKLLARAEEEFEEKYQHLYDKEGI